VKRLGKLVAFAIIGLALTTPTAVHADPGVASHMKADGTVAFSDMTCTWTGASTSDNPPNPLTIYRSTINLPGGNLYCDPSGFTLTFNNDPNVVFNGDTAVIDRINSTVGSCTYETTNVVLTNGSGTFTAYRVGIGIWCPSSVTGSITLVFH
jgi:hypothetical protein